MKEKIANCLLLSVRIWGTAWLSFLVSVVPLYIWRGTQSDTVGENILMSIIGLVSGFLILMLLQMRDDKAHSINLKDLLLLGGGGVGFYIIAWIIAHILTQNNYFIAVLGYHFSCLLGTGTHGQPTFFATLISALMFGVVYFIAIVLGGVIARYRYKCSLG